MAGTDVKLDLIRKVPLFATCDGRDIKQIGALAELVDLPAGQVIVRQGATGHEFFIVADGALRVERDGQVINHLGPGEFAGEIALIDGGPRTASVVVDVPSTVLLLGHREFHSLLEQYPSIQLKILQTLARRVRATDPESIN